jgi:hypothetical protein
VTGLFGPEPIDGVATWVAALVTILVLGGLLGERRAFGWTQHLLAGLATGFLALLAITEVIVPRLVEPFGSAGGGSPALVLGIGLVAVTAAAPWVPRVASAVPLSIAIGAIAAFALGGAVIGTLLPQLAATAGPWGSGPAGAIATLAAAIVTALVLLSFLHGAPRGPVVGRLVGAGRWLLLAGIGGWLGFLLFSRLVLLVDRVAFLLGDWLGALR